MKHGTVTKWTPHYRSTSMKLGLYALGAGIDSLFFVFFGQCSIVLAGRGHFVASFSALAEIYPQSQFGDPGTGCGMSA